MGTAPSLSCLVPTWAELISKPGMVSHSPQQHPEAGVGVAPQSCFPPPLAKGGRHTSLIPIFWLFDNRRSVVLSPQPSSRPYLHIAGLTDFSPGRVHYSQVINCLKLFLKMEMLETSGAAFSRECGQDEFQTAYNRDPFCRLTAPSSVTSLTRSSRWRNHGFTFFMHSGFLWVRLCSPT